jgi:hypothetical protein
MCKAALIERRSDQIRTRRGGPLMELPWLMNQIETHAEQLTERIIQAVRTSPRIKSLSSLSEEELRRCFFDLYRNLGRWLGKKGEEGIEATYGDIGRRRCREGVPLNELIYALICGVRS